MGGIEDVRDNLFDLMGIYRGLILGLTTVAILWILYRLTTKGVRRYLISREQQRPENVQQFLLIWRYAWLGVVVAFGLIAFSGSLSGIGLSAAFLGMILGWSLQAPVTGIAAWLMIILKRPFRIGDRVIIAGIIGDVVDISLTHVLLNQVGGTIGGEEKSNRAVLIPNATLFQQVIYNYTLSGLEGEEAKESAASYILDEVVVMITFGSELDEAERLLIRAAGEVTADIVAETNQEPFIRAEIFEHGVRIRLRYNTLAKDRQRITSDISRLIIRDLKKSHLVEFCFPHSQILYRYNPDSLPPPVDRERQEARGALDRE
ncbi:MAG: mechanosensitive ion channel family protein [candidate division Zixibacteria bacterium]|nr:mechanosensitive ion channel family protein [candidate division Zixibacteria bacterium]